MFRRMLLIVLSESWPIQKLKRDLQRFKLALIFTGHIQRLNHGNANGKHSTVEHEEIHRNTISFLSQSSSIRLSSIYFLRLWPVWICLDHPNVFNLPEITVKLQGQSNEPHVHSSGAQKKHFSSERCLHWQAMRIRFQPCLAECLESREVIHVSWSPSCLMAMSLVRCHFWDAIWNTLPITHATPSHQRSLW